MSFVGCRACLIYMCLTTYEFSFTKCLFTRVARAHKRQVVFAYPGGPNLCVGDWGGPCGLSGTEQHFHSSVHGWDHPGIEAGCVCAVICSVISPFFPVHVSTVGPHPPS